MVNKSPATSPRKAGPTPLSPERKAKAPNKEDIASQQSDSIGFEVKDIGGSNLPSLLAAIIRDNLVTPDASGKRLLPSAFLSDDNGLKMWSRITHLPAYYQTRDEIELLERCGAEIVRSLGTDNGKGMVVVDLGAGDIRKVLPLLLHLDSLSIPVVYYALDLSSQTLQFAMERLKKANFKYITCYGLWGTFDAALNFVKTLPVDTPRLFLSLGSSFGNDHHKLAVARLQAWRDEMRVGDRMLLGMDGTTDRNDIWLSYHPSNGLFDRFIRNGLLVSNLALGVDWYQHDDWELEGMLTMEPFIMHRFIFTAKREVKCDKLGWTMKKGEKIDCYEAFKYGMETMRGQFSESGLKEMGTWKSGTGRINQYLLRKDVDAKSAAENA